MKIRKTLVGLAALLAALAPLTACGGDGDKAVPAAESATSTVTTSAGTAPSPDVAPSKDDLEAMIARALDPSIPAVEKTELVQGAENDSALFDTLVELKAQNPSATWIISDVINITGPGQAEAEAAFNIDGVDQAVTVEFVFDDGRWKISQQYACSMIKLAQDQGTPVFANGCAG